MQKEITKQFKKLLPGLLPTTLGIFTAFGACAIPILALGVNPLYAYLSLFEGAFGNFFVITETLRQATPLLIAGAGWLVSFRAGLYSLGVDGQMQMGALFGVFVALTFGGAPLLLGLALLCGFLGGALWGGVVGALKTKFGVSEIISTVMMNYIAYYVVFYAAVGPLGDPTWQNALTPVIPSAAWLPRLFPSPSILDAGLFIGLMAAPLVYIFLKKTTLGYRIRVVGESPEVARVQGFKVTRTVLISMLISGGMAGLAGMAQISGGVSHRLTPGFSSTAGWAAIFATLLASRNPLGLILSSILYASLIVGANTMAYATGIPVYMSTLLQALVVLFVFVSQNIGLVRKFLSRI